MNFEQQALFFFSAIGAFNGLFLSIYLAFIVKNKNQGTYFLAALLFVISVRVTKSVFLNFYPQTGSTFIQVGLIACTLIGPFSYLYAKRAITGIDLRPWKWLVHIISIIIVMIILGVLFPYKEHYLLWRRTNLGIFGIGLTFQWSVYMILAIVQIWHPILKLLSRKQKVSNTEFWAVTIIFCVTLIWLAYNTTEYTSYIVGALSFSFTFYITLTIWFFKIKKVPVEFSQSKRYADKKIEKELALTIASELNSIFANSEVYKNPDTKLADIALKMSINPHQLSQYLNDNLGKNFTTFINEYRVEAASKLLKENEHLTIEAIGNECGFKSNSSFYSAFKKMYGLTPAQFKKRSI